MKIAVASNIEFFNIEKKLFENLTEKSCTRIIMPVSSIENRPKNYYYKDEVHRDSVVSVPAMLKMFDELGTAKNSKIKQSMPNAGNHVLGSYIKSKDLLGVQQAIESFMEKKLHLHKVLRLRLFHTQLFHLIK